MQVHSTLIDACFRSSPNVRYVAAYLDGEVVLRSRADVQLLGSNESDQYEELIVNPTLVKLLTQRGNIDCGGFRHAVATYGLFHAFIYPVARGHVTVSFELDSRLDDEVPRVVAVIDRVLAA